MAVKQRGASWQADITIPGHKRMRETFASREEGEAWIARVKADAAAGRPFSRPETPDSGPSERDKSARFASVASKVHALYWQGKASDAITLLTIRELVAFFGPTTAIADIDTERVDDFVEGLVAKRNANATINRKLACLSKIMRYAASRGVIDRAPVIERKRAGVGRIRFFTKEEEARVLELFTQLGKDDHRDAVECLIDTGMRPGELYSVPAKDFDLKAGSITIWVNKTDNPRTIYMTERVRRIVSRRKSGVASQEASLFPYDKFWMRHSWDRVRSLMGLDADKHFVPYVCRHTCASRMVQRGVALPVIRDWLGHKGITMTMRYAHLAPANLKAAVAALETGEAA